MEIHFKNKSSSSGYESCLLMRLPPPPTAATVPSPDDQSNAEKAHGSHSVPVMWPCLPSSLAENIRARQVLWEAMSKLCACCIPQFLPYTVEVMRSHMVPQSIHVFMTAINTRFRGTGAGEGHSVG